MQSHRVLVVGAGYGGVVAATTLARPRDVAITLVNDRADFISCPNRPG